MREGIARFLPPLNAQERQVQGVFDFEHARYRDSQRVSLRPELAEQLCGDLGLARSWFKDKLVLDAGCGSGRWSYALAILGARVVAVDLTDSGVRATREALAPFSECIVHQASLFDLPYAPGTFDLVMSWGVLHHTPDTRSAFERLVPLVKRGGMVYVMVYERTARRYRILTDVVRALFRRLPDAARYRACRSLVIRNPRWYALVSPWLKVCDASAAQTASDIETLVFDTFDAYSPLFNHVHDQTEVRQWFFDEGLSDVALTHPVRFTTAEEIARWGECGGAVHVRGKRAPSLLVHGDRSSDAAHSLRAVGFVADDVESAGAWLNRMMGAPAPQLDGASLVERNEAELVRSPGTTRMRDLWHGVEWNVPSEWRLRRDGRLLSMAPDVAQPPFQMGVFVTPAQRNAGLAEQALRATRRGLPPTQTATLIAESALDVDGRLAHRYGYQISLGHASTESRQVFVVHEGALIQLSATGAWDASATTLAAMVEQFDRLRLSTRLLPPRRDTAALVQHLFVLANGFWARVRRIWARVNPLIGRRSARRKPPSPSPATAYDATIDVGRLAAWDGERLVEEACRATETYVRTRASRPGPVAGSVPR